MAVELWSGLGGVGLFAAPGLGLTELLPTVRRLPLARRLAYGYLLGMTGVAGTLYALSHLFGVPLRRPAVLTVVALPTVAGLTLFLVRRHRRSRIHRIRGTARRHGVNNAALRAWVRRAGGPLPLLAAAVAAAVGLGVVAQTASNPLTDWDGRMTWCAQALYIRHEGTVDPAVMRDKRWFITHPQYPLLLPVAQVAALEAFAGAPDSHLFRPLYAAFLPVLLLLVYDGARSRAGKNAAALAALSAALVPFFAYGEGSASSSYSDLPLACFFGGAVVLLWRPGRRRSDALAAGVLLAAAVLTKNEGAPLAVLVLALAFWSPIRSHLRQGGRRPGSAAGELARFGAAAAPALLALALLLCWRSGIPNRQDENYFGRLDWSANWPGAVGQVAVFGPVLVARMFSWRDWSAFWWMAPAVLLAGTRALRLPANRRCLIAAAGPPAIGWAAYSVHLDPAYLAQVTWDRFLLQAAVPLLIALAAALNEVLAGTLGSFAGLRPRRKRRAGPEGTERSG
ncbi:MAG TPA: glycosyltransferase family 39 protein [Thermoanaerobaculia bacterium]|nr:glycosyltransferase family 39 protein [Thermoanaerobaculia bacterium]